MKKLITIIMTVALIAVMMPSVAFASDTDQRTLTVANCWNDNGDFFEEGEVPGSADLFDQVYLYEMSTTYAVYIKNVTSDGTISRTLISDASKLKIVDKNGNVVGQMTNNEQNSNFMDFKLNKFIDCEIQYTDGGETLTLPINTRLSEINCAKNYKKIRDTYLAELNCSNTKTNWFYVISSKISGSKLKVAYENKGKRYNIAITKKNPCFSAKKVNVKGKTVYKITLKRPFCSSSLDFSGKGHYAYINLNYNMSAKLKVLEGGKVFAEQPVFSFNLVDSPETIESIWDYEAIEKSVRYMLYPVADDGYEFAGFYYGSKKLSTEIYRCAFYDIVDSTGKTVDDQGRNTLTCFWEAGKRLVIGISGSESEEKGWNVSNIKFDNDYAEISLDQYLEVTGYTLKSTVFEGDEYHIYSTKSGTMYGRKIGNKVTTLVGKTITAKFKKVQ